MIKYAVVVLNSTGGSGKGTFVEYCKAFCNELLYISIVDPTKAIAKQMGWEGNHQKSEEDRLFLSRIKDAHTNYNDGPFTYVVNVIKEFISIMKNSKMNIESKYMLFIDMREPIDIQKFKELEFDNRFTALLVNNRVSDITSNHADAEVYDISYDYVIENNTTLDKLKDGAKAFVNDVFKNIN